MPLSIDEKWIMQLQWLIVSKLILMTLCYFCFAAMAMEIIINNERPWILHLVALPTVTAIQIDYFLDFYNQLRIKKFDIMVII